MGSATIGLGSTRLVAEPYSLSPLSFQRQGFSNRKLGDLTVFAQPDRILPLHSRRKGFGNRKSIDLAILAQPNPLLPVTFRGRRFGNRKSIDKTALRNPIPFYRRVSGARGFRQPEIGRPDCVAEPDRILPPHFKSSVKRIIMSYLFISPPFFLPVYSSIGRGGETTTTTTTTTGN